MWSSGDTCRVSCETAACIMHFHRMHVLPDAFRFSSRGGRRRKIFLALRYGDVDLVATAVPVQARHQPARGKSGGRQNPQPALVSADGRAARTCVKRIQDWRQVLKVGPARLRKLQPLRQSLEQAPTQQFFERLDLVADGGRRKAELLCRTGETQPPRSRLERPQGRQRRNAPSGAG